MCLYPRLMRNRKYQPNKKNGGVIPAVNDPRALYVAIGCGECIECRKQKARSWQVRLLEDLKDNRNGKFITLTFNNKSIRDLCNEDAIKSLTGYRRDNAIAKLATRRFLERWRKTHGKSLRHWFVTELGGNGTENIHLHGIVWTDVDMKIVEKHWTYGFMWRGEGDSKKNYVNEKTMAYCTKYVMKMDEKHKRYKPIILTSPGIGKGYMLRHNKRLNRYAGAETDESYRTTTGHKVALPIYWRNKLWTDSERESLWMYRLDRNERWVCGEKVAADNHKQYFGLLKYHRERNSRLGYGKGEKDWDAEEYEHARRELLTGRRIQKAGRCLRPGLLRAPLRSGPARASRD